MSKTTTALAFIAGAATVMLIQRVHAKITFVEAPADLPQEPRPLPAAEPQRTPRPAQRHRTRVIAGNVASQPHPHTNLR
ncbi:hypothetical protein [Lacticaseibacillus pantheris]|uniref:hypothetical protein n=1 Tax=Lacticaseibacillus pantheris TaxID=171523 RepID=UPI00259262AA|nr:hypothetical protein [Lacticaseibacillus pantheris]WKF83963.1 hypothetical protein QY874_06580 [Lacticaseibacillus pantheris]